VTIDAGAAPDDELALADEIRGFFRRVFVSEEKLFAADLRRILGARRIVFVCDRVVDYVVRWDARAAEAPGADANEGRLLTGEG
jgi:hypothetical protein